MIESAARKTGATSLVIALYGFIVGFVLTQWEVSTAAVVMGLEFAPFAMLTPWAIYYGINVAKLNRTAALFSCAAASFYLGAYAVDKGDFSVLITVMILLGGLNLSLALLVFAVVKALRVRSASK